MESLIKFHVEEVLKMVVLITTEVDLENFLLWLSLKTS